MKRIATIVIVTLGSAGMISCDAQQFNNTPVPYLDVNRYLGRWYEIARYDHVFERDMNYATADYALKKNGKLSIINSGMKGSKQKISKGKAHLTSTPGLLRVSFFGPFYSDYRVLMIGPDYNYALVGSRSKNYLWILSRSPTLPEEDLEEIMGEACLRGYSVSKLIWVKH